MANIIYLASYPKSGNTWLRIIIKRLLFNSSIHINCINLGVMSSYKKLLKLEKHDMNEDEILLHRNKIYKKIADTKENFFMKVHDCFKYLPKGEPLFPTENNKAIIIIRNPLDVVISYAHHSDISIDESIERLNKGGTFGNSFTNNNHVTQHIGFWKENVITWVNADIEKIIIRYEDLHDHPEDTIKQIAEFLGISASDRCIAKTIEDSDFRKLKKQEEFGGFIEKPKKSLAFFREGRKEQYKEVLSKEQIERVLEENKDIMKKFGYQTEGLFNE